MASYKDRHMTTSDGITDSDWESIIISAEEIAELTGREIDARFAQKKILSQLDRLEKKYGRLPTILSTKADYIDSTDERLSLLKEAYITADEIQDKKNKVFISGSIIEIYLELPEKKSFAQYWLEKFESDLKDYPKDEYLLDLHVQFNKKINQLNPSNQ
ncbi:hypothetical protein F8135_23735 [Pseudomonas aeruginosa]|nr:hypothetical protein F7O92_31335 [Pseudomonas aeruginosa]KAB5447527.1 hypothetical protein F8135_23735 [Pseudomonas aeruginosa]KQJ61988.1 hypothetical protein AN400_17235 [Pseudomonas aeruginosa]KSC03770.1 hypothetical protein AO879_05800 [Pseudomonas aeruginosa]KSC35053.1 hypothetical protein AO881_27190 [Pseudomonas aeruginosa]